MVHQISRREILNNLIRFRDILLEMRGQNREKERKYRVLLNKKTGDMRFAQKISAIEHHIARRGKKEPPEDWKEIYVIVHQKSPSDIARFEAHDVSNKAIKPSDMDPMAWRIVTETLEVLNAKAREVKGKQGEMLAEEAVLQDLSSIHLSPLGERIEDLPGWMGAISRMQAEERLHGKPVGTYLMRDGDEITVSISFHFAEENGLSIHPYLLTVVESEEKISDVLLLQTNQGWTLYHDDPNLEDKALYHYFPSPQVLLRTLGNLVRYPLS